MKKLFKAGTIITAAIIAGALAGCGDSGSAATTAAPAAETAPAQTEVPSEAAEETEAATEGESESSTDALTEEQAMEAVKNYLFSVNPDLKKMAESVGINKTLSFHVARHTFATNVIAAGGDLFTVSKLLGHKDIQTTQVYADVIMPTRIDAVNKLSDFFGQG